MVSVVLLLVVLSTVSVSPLRLQCRPIHSPNNKQNVDISHRGIAVLSLSKENSDVSQTHNTWLQKVKRSALPVLVALSVTASTVMPASARANKEVPTTSNVKQAIKKDTHKYNNYNKNAAEMNKKVVRVSLDVADDRELQQQKRAETLTKLGLAVAAICAAYVILPSGGRKTQLADATTPTPEDRKDIRALKSKHKYDRITDTLETADRYSYFDDVEELYPMHSTRRNVNLVPKEAPLSVPGSRKRPQQEQPNTRLRPSGPYDILFDGETSIDEALSSGKQPGKAVSEQADVDRKHYTDASNVGADGIQTPPAAERAAKGKGRKSTSSKGSEAATFVNNDVTNQTPPAVSEVPSFVNIQPAPASSKLTSPPPTATPPHPPAAAKKGPGGFLGRFFNKPGSNRPSDIATALHAEDPTVAHYRALVAENLFECMPLGALPDAALISVNELLNAAGVGVEDEAGGQRQVLSLQQASTQAGLSDTAAAEAFADVTNAMLVTLIDAAAAFVDTKDADSLDLSVERLDSVAEFMENVGVLYGEVFPNVVVDPIKYNGKVKGNKLEELYYRYTKASMDMKSQLSGMLGGGTRGDAKQDTDSGDGIATDGDTGAVTAERRAEWLGRIQFLFDLKDSKQQSIQQRVMKELMLDMTQGDGAGDFAQLMESMVGGAGNTGNRGGYAGAAGGSPFPQDFDFGSFAEAMQKGGELPKNIPGMPDFGNMSSEEMQEVTAQAQSQMKHMLRDGLLTKNDVLQFEKAIGITVEGMLSAMGVNGTNKQQVQAQVGPDAADLVDMFQQMAAIKKR